MIKSEYDDALNKLDAWGRRKGLEICKGYGIDAYFHEEKHIVYNTKIKSKKNQVYSLLHECGHALAFSSKGYKDNFPTMHTLRFKEAPVNKRRNVFKCEEIVEEWDAWKRGFNLSKRLGIDLDREDYYNYASRWVMTYIRKVA
tara:strand:- start:11136 stop:11564 length:429 start_codon:yes stop_codon:yes gene_type:complete